MTRVICISKVSNLKFQSIKMTLWNWKRDKNVLTHYLEQNIYGKKFIQGEKKRYLESDIFFIYPKIYSFYRK